MSTKYIIIASSNISGYPIPILDDEDMALFDKRSEAVKCAESMPICVAGGYKIFKWEM